MRKTPEKKTWIAARRYFWNPTLYLASIIRAGNQKVYSTQYPRIKKWTSIHHRVCTAAVAAAAAPTIDSRTSSSCAVEKQIYPTTADTEKPRYGIFTSSGMWGSWFIGGSNFSIAKYWPRQNNNRDNPRDVWDFPQLAAKWIVSTVNSGHLEIAGFWITCKRRVLDDQTLIFTTDGNSRRLSGGLTCHQRPDSMSRQASLLESFGMLS